MNQAANRSGSMSGAASLPYSVTIQRRIRRYVRRVLACSAAQGGEVGVDGLAEGDVTGGRGEVADRPIADAIRGNGHYL